MPPDITPIDPSTVTPPPSVESTFHVSPWAWVATVVFVLALIGWDLWKHRVHKVETVKASAYSTLWWTLLGLAFTIPVWMIGNHEEGVQYLSSYLLERSLSLDNVFVFVVILSYFAVPAKLQHVALLWGVVLALVLRVIFILAGAALIERFDWTIAVFGVILIITAIKLATSGDDEVDPSKNVGLKLLRKFTPVSDNFREAKMTVIEKGKRIATPMLAVLLVIGTTDLLFAVDSVPAVYGITTIPFIVFAANAFSLMGLRPMASLLAGVMDRFIYLPIGLSLVLGLVGLKMVASVVFDFHPANWIPLVGVVLIIGASIGLSLLKTRERNELTNA